MLITLLSLFSLSELPKVEVQLSFGDKIVHAVFYAFLTIFCYLFMLVEWQKYKKRRTLLVSSVLSFIYGMIIEGLQYVLPYKRSADWFDVLANSLGVFLAILVIRCIIDRNKALKTIN